MADCTEAWSRLRGFRSPILLKASRHCSNGTWHKTAHHRATITSSSSRVRERVRRKTLATSGGRAVIKSSDGGHVPRNSALRAPSNVLPSALHGTPKGFPQELNCTSRRHGPFATATPSRLFHGGAYDFRKPRGGTSVAGWLGGALAPSSN